MKMNAEHYKARQVRIGKEMKARREAERLNYIDQSKPGWSRNMTRQELLDSRQYPHINVSNL